MIKRVLIWPTGESNVAPCRKVVKSLLSLPYDDWIHGSGDASAIFEEEDSGKGYTLLMIPNDSGGFFLEYIDKSETVYNPYVPWSDAAVSGEETVIVGGEEHALPSEAFVLPKIAEDVIVDFLEVGCRSVLVQWKRRTDVRWPSSED